jgi:exocyst complex component 2
MGRSLGVQAQAERIRSVQGVLQRFRTLFNLPSAIRTHIKNKEFDLVVREYKKAKSLIVPTKVRALRQPLSTCCIFLNKTDEAFARGP